MVALSLGLLVASSGRVFAADSLAGLADPTRPYSGIPAASQRRPGMVLQSTLVSPLQRMAVIDGRTVKVGERIDGARILQIRPYDVLVERSGRRRVLHLLPQLHIERTKR